MQVTFAGAVDKVRERLEALCIAGLLVLALLYRLVPINRGLGQDELFSAVQFIEVPSILRTIFYNIAFNNHIGYSVMARVSESLLGRSEWALRLPALLLGAATIYVLYLFTRPLLGRIPALLAALLLALSPAHIEWSVEARGYSALIFFTLLSSYFYIKLLDHPTRRNAIPFIVVSVLGIYVHLYAIFVTAVQILLFLLALVRQSAIQRMKGSTHRIPVRLLAISFLSIVCLSFLLYLPILAITLRDLVSRGRSDFNPTFPLEMLRDLAGSDSPLIFGSIALLAVWGWFSLRKTHRREADYFALLLVVPLLTMWLARPFDLYTRFFAYWLPYLVVFSVAGMVALAQLRWNRASRLVHYLPALATTLIVLAVLFNWTRDWQTRTTDEGYRAVSQAVMKDASPSAVYCAIGGSRSVWQHYIDKPIINPLTLADLQELAQRNPEVRCVYYEAAWQDRGQTEIAQFLFAHGTWGQVEDLTWFVYQAGR